jgi:FAD/FMN-containing dehydrogenase
MIYNILIYGEGGIGYFAPKAGFACDNVLSFQVVLANGSIINANATSHFALYRALKGGSNNFGIVTRYTFRTFEQGLFYVGNVIYPATTVLSQITAFSEFISNRSYDDNAAIMQSFGFSPSVGAVIVNQPVYAKPIFDPPIFKSFLSIQPQLSNTRNITDLASFSAQDAQMSAEGL